MIFTGATVRIAFSSGSTSNVLASSNLQLESGIVQIVEDATGLLKTAS